MGISARAVRGGVSASPGQGTPLIDFVAATGAFPTNFELFGTRAANFLVAAIANACADLIESPPEPDPRMAPVQVNLVKDAGPSPAGPPSGQTPRGRAGTRSPRGPGKAKERRRSRFPTLRSHGVVAERLGFTNRDVLSRSSFFLKGIK